MITAELAGVQLWVATTPVDMRKSFDSLVEVMQNFLGRDLLSGNLFVFRNKSGHLAKILWWDRDGLVIYCKRLKRGDLKLPRTGKAAIKINAEQLMQSLDIRDAMYAGRSPQHAPL